MYAVLAAESFTRLCSNARAVQCCLQVSMLSGGSQGHPRIFPGCPPTRSPHAVWIVWTSQDPPWMSTHTQPSMLSGLYGHPRILPGCPPTHSPPCCLDCMDIPGSSLVVPPHTALHAVWRFPSVSKYELMPSKYESTYYY